MPLHERPKFVGMPPPSAFSSCQPLQVAGGATQAANDVANGARTAANYLVPKCSASDTAICVSAAAGCVAACGTLWLADGATGGAATGLAAVGCVSCLGSSYGACKTCYGG